MNLPNDSPAAFRQALHTHFSTELNHECVKLELTEVDVKADTPEQECFSLLLAGPKEPILDQQTYRLSHEQLGEQFLFVVPVGMENGRIL